MISLSDQLVRNWALADDGNDIADVGGRVTYLSKKLFDDYEPSQFQRFKERLDTWLGNVSDDEERKTLYRLAGSIFFVGRMEFESLCRAAFHGPIIRWIIDGLRLAFDDPDACAKLERAVNETWFCPVTDSMRINAFLKVNQLDGKQLRPEWRSLARFGDAEKIRSFIEKASIKRIVLLEDFVGSGTQIEPAVRYAAELLPDMPIICCPLIICPDGIEVGERLSGEHQNLTFEPIFRLQPDQLIKYERIEDEPQLFTETRALIAREAHRMTVKTGPETHGFAATGALVVLYSNCPNNTLPVIHDATDRWYPLFPRIRRR